MRALPLLFLLACAGTPEPEPEATPAPVANDLPNPLVPDHVLLPYPSDQYLVDDDSTPSGKRIDIPAELMPTDFVPSMIEADGFPRLPPMVAALEGSFDPSTLPDPADWGATLSADSPVIVARANDGELMPVLAELDVRVEDADRRPLILRSHRVLDPATRYVVILKRSLKAADGSDHEVPPAVADLLSGEPMTERARASWVPAFEDVASVLDTHGVDASEVLLAWTFTTRSTEDATTLAIATQTHAGAAPLGTWSLEEPDYSEAGKALVYGRLEVPNYLDETGRIRIRDDGTAEVFGTMSAPILITIPDTIEANQPTMLFGHGFFSAIEEPSWANLFDSLAAWKMSAVTTEFFGFSENTLLDTLPLFGADVSNIDTVIHRQLQSQANFTAVHRLMRGELADAVEVDFGNGPLKPLSATETPYMGISNGGTQGLVMMATSPSLSRGALIVPGGGWSHMLQRASQWAELGGVLTGRYSDPRDLQIAMSMLQTIFDPVDSLNYADMLVRDRLDGRVAEPEILMIEAMGDEQVANLVTRWVALNAGVPLVKPSPVDVWGLEEAADDAAVGYSIYDLGAPPVPEGNISPVDFGTHGDVRLLDSYKEQVQTFLTEGRVIHPCEGPCDPE